MLLRQNEPPDFFVASADFGARYARELRRSFPRLLKRKIAAGVSYGPGWHWIVQELVREIDDLLDDRQARSFRVTQIKEKFGQLRVYYAVGRRRLIVADFIDPASGSRYQARAFPERSEFPIEEIEQLISAASKASKAACYTCGASGTLRARSWYYVSCDHCEELRQEAIKRRAEDDKTQ